MKKDNRVWRWIFSNLLQIYF